MQRPVNTTRELQLPSLIILSLLVFIQPSADAAQMVNVYSARQEALIKPLLDRFSEQTGIQVNLVTGNADALLARLELEGDNSPADVLITVDAGRLFRAKTAGLLQQVRSKTLDELVPANYRDTDDYWFGLSIRARVLIAAKNKPDRETIDSYEALASPALRGKVCIRSSDSIYNQSLVASMIAAHGEQKVLQWASEVVDNFARSPTGGDRDQILAVAGGLCDVAIANMYYYAMMLSGDDPHHQKAAKKVAIIWPNQDGRGTHVNISGAAVTVAAKQREGATQAAVRLIEYLASEPSQRWYVEINNEYPLVAENDVNPVLKSWGKFNRDPLNLDRLGELNSAAVRLMDEAGWN